METFFISDTHFGHFNIIRYCQRPFKNLEEMDSTIIKNWNQRVKPEDTVFHLGDFGFNRSSEAPEGKKPNYYLEQLNGHIIILHGSHDRNNQIKTIIDGIRIGFGGETFYLTHNPDHRDKDIKINLCGHTHGKYGLVHEYKGNIIVDLSVENWNYRPVNIGEINSAIAKFKKTGKVEYKVHYPEQEK